MQYTRRWQAKVRPALTLTISELDGGFRWSLSPRAGASKHGWATTFEKAEADALRTLDAMPRPAPHPNGRPAKRRVHATLKGDET